MKKTKLDLPEGQQSRNIQRADIAPVDGFAMVVDGHFKTQLELIATYPMLRVEICDASAQIRTLVKYLGWNASASPNPEAVAGSQAERVALGCLVSHGAGTDAQNISRM
jgi:hypothetical protein